MKKRKRASSFFNKNETSKIVKSKLFLVLLAVVLLLVVGIVYYYNNNRSGETVMDFGDFLSFNWLFGGVAVQGVCAPLGSPCTTEDNRPGTCGSYGSITECYANSGGMINEPCTPNPVNTQSDCGSGLICVKFRPPNPDDYYCAPATSYCGDGNINTGEECDPPNTATCDADCKTIIANPDKCAGKPTPPACQKCDAITGENVADDAAACTGTDPCKTYSCSGGACAGTNKCPANKICEAGECKEPPACTKDSDCFSNSFSDICNQGYCDKSTSSWKCGSKAKDKVCREKDSKNDCDVADKCTAGSDSKSSCPEDVKNHNGESCTLANGKKGTCSSDGNCVANDLCANLKPGDAIPASCGCPEGSKKGTSDMGPEADKYCWSCVDKCEKDSSENPKPPTLNPPPKPPRTPLSWGDRFKNLFSWGRV